VSAGSSRLQSRQKLFVPSDILDRAAKIDKTVNKLESFLRKHFDALVEKQNGCEHAVADIVWRQAGWGELRESSPISPTKNVTVYWRSQGQEAEMKAAGFFVNVTDAGRRSVAVKELIGILHGLFSDKGPRSA
jgi:hypothetical protein